MFSENPQTNSHMKSIFTKLSVIIALFVISCNNVTSGDGSNKITGNGKVVAEVRELQPFHAVSMEGVFNVTLTQGTKESVQVEGDENILPVIITVVENDTLKVKMKDNTSIQKMSKLNVNITLVSISNLNSQGVGSLKCTDTLRLKDLQLNLEGVGNTELNLVANQLTVTSNIVGTLSLAGMVQEAFIDHDGVGALKAFDLQTGKMTLHSNGVGAAEIFASQEIIIDASGVGGVKYKGGAAKQQINNNGVGKVVCVDCK